MLSRLFRRIKEYGLYLAMLRLLKKVNYKFISVLNILEKRYIRRTSKDYKELKDICKDPKYKSVFVFYPFLIWNLPAFQRPQQIASALSKQDDVLYIYCTPDPYADKVSGLYKKISKNLIVTADYEFVANLKLKNKIIQFYSTDVAFSYKQVEKALKRGDKVLYEYIDGIDEKLLGKIPQSYLDKHYSILKNEKIYVVASADKLIRDVQEYRNNNYSLICNGVTLNDFKMKNNKMPDELKEINDKYDKIVCYYGALANWFDYKLLIKCAKRYPKYAFVLIGIDFDKTLEKSGIKNYDNIIYLGKIPYKNLINYTKYADLLTIPFVINHITESTSPVKLFEYMATKKPILTTAMPECKKYKSVIIGKDHDDYVNKIEDALKLSKNKKYLDTLIEEAKMNTWKMKALDILKLINKED